MSAPVRTVLAATAASLVAGCSLAPSALAALDCHKNAPPVIHDGFPQPPARYSRHGLLDTRLRASVGTVRFGGRPTVAMNYEGSSPGPTLVVCAGDRMVVHFQNDLDQPTNLHMHGFHVKPTANHDNVYLDLKPGTPFTYEYQVPMDQPAGTYWYHPHKHMYVDDQIFGGLAGAIVQEGGLDRLPALRHVPQRWMVIQNEEIQGGAIVPAADENNANDRLYVNGTSNPTVRIQPGALQRWRIFNADAGRIVVFRLPGGQPFHVLAEDGNTLARTRAVSRLVIAPGSRREVLVRGPRPGTYPMKAVPFAQFPGGDTVAGGGPPPNQTVLTMRSAGRTVRHHPPVPRTLAHPEDLRKEKVDRKRRIVFSEDTLPDQSTGFLLNGEMFDPNRVITMKLNSLEEWTLVNATTEWHTFHIHINPFQVVSVGGKRRSYVDFEDNVAIPPQSNVVIRQRPIDFTGKFVLHCHVVFHEDHGMMAAVQVLRHPTTSQLSSSVSGGGGLTVSSGAYGARTVPAVYTGATTFDFFCLLGGAHELVPGIRERSAATSHAVLS